MKYFDLVLVALNGGGKEVCMAPRLAVQAGDVVETEFGFGKVLKTAFCSDDDEVFMMFNAEHTVRRVKNLMKPIKYHEDDDEDA